MGDAEAIRQFHRKSWRDTYPNEAAGVSREWIEETTDEWLLPERMEKSRELYQSVLDDADNQYYRLVEVDGEVLGFVHGVRRSSDNGKQYLNAIYIDKSLQGTGVAQKLIDGLFGFLDLNEDIWLEVANYNERAKGFYQKNGFAVVEGSEFLFKDVIPSIKMARRGGR
jgi:ribosomal protein S18 acetylase RimI-like enzyme